MPDVVATGSLSLPFAKAAELLAATPAFQSLCGVGSAALALPSVEYPYFDLNDDATLPRAVLWKHRGMSRHNRKRIAEESGALLLTLYAEIPLAYRGDERNDLMDWSNKVGAILDQMTELACSLIPGGADWYWRMTEYDEIEPPGWLEESETGVSHCRIACYRLHWV